MPENCFTAEHQELSQMLLWAVAQSDVALETAFENGHSIVVKYPWNWGAQMLRRQKAADALSRYIFWQDTRFSVEGQELLHLLI